MAGSFTIDLSELKESLIRELNEMREALQTNGEKFEQDVKNQGEGEVREYMDSVLEVSQTLDKDCESVD